MNQQQMFDACKSSFLMALGNAAVERLNSRPEDEKSTLLSDSSFRAQLDLLDPGHPQCASTVDQALEAFLLCFLVMP